MKLIGLWCKKNFEFGQWTELWSEEFSNTVTVQTTVLVGPTESVKLQRLRIVWSDWMTGSG